jgi:hypothetical protein
MKLLRVIPVCIAAMSLTFVHAQPASQTAQDTSSVTKAEKKARAKAKKAAEKTSEATGQSAATPGTETTATPPAKKARTSTGSAQRAVPTVSQSEIDAAKASGKVWVNTDTGVYHKGGQWYGATKQGKFMTEDEAVKAGYRASKAKEK